MEEDEQNREIQLEKRKVSINERENIYQKERRRSDGKSPFFIGCRL